MGRVILFVIDQLEAGGTERQLSYLVKELSAIPDLTVHCYVWNHSTGAFYFEYFEETLSGEVVGLAENGSFRKKIIHLRKTVSRLKPNRIVSYSTFTNFQVFLASLLNRAKPFGAIRGSSDYILGMMGFTSIMSLAFPRTMLSCSRVASADFKKMWWLKHVEYRYFSNSIDLSVFPRKSHSQVNEYDSISIGTLLPGKRLERLFDMIDATKESYPEIKHIHLGDGPLLEEYREKVKEMGLDDHLIFIGKTKAVKDYLLKSKMLLHFSDFEGIANVVLEAMAVGLPVISTDCGDVRYFVLHKKNGYMVGRGDDYNHEEFKEHYHKLLDSKSLIEEMGDASYEEISHYGVEKMAPNFLNLIDLN